MSEQPTPATHTGVHALFNRLADHLDLKPNQPADLHTIRGHGRALGLDEDWLTFLPAPDGTHHSEYATQLRHLAGPTP
jgi:hypothetical protein